MPQNAEAAIVSKVITKVAKKMIKEVTKDSAVNQASKIILEYQMESMLKDAYKIPDGYEAVCFEHATSKCNKPALVKKNITANDKKVIGSKIDDILDSKAGMTPFLKFVDWLVPVWAIGLTVSVLQYSTDPDFKKFMDDIAMEALYAMGFIIPIQDKSVVTETPVSEYQPIKDNTPTNFYTNQIYRSGITINPINIDLTPYTLEQKKQIIYTVDYTSHLNMRVLANGKYVFGNNFGHNRRYEQIYDGYLTMPLSVNYLSQPENSREFTTWATSGNYTYREVFDGYNDINTKVNFKISQYDDGRPYIEIFALGTNGHIIATSPTSSISLEDINTITIEPGSHRYISDSFFDVSYNISTYKTPEIPLPTPDEIIDYSSPLETTPYKQGSTVYFPSPKTIEYTTPDEKKITPSPTTPGEFIDEEGNVVPEDDVIVSDPKVETTPDGDIVYTPEPTPENPNPTPEPITPPNETELGHKLPFEFVLALLKVLKATLNFMKVQFLFFATLPFIPEREIPFEMFQAFKDFKPFNFPIYATVQGFAAFTSTFLIFRVIRRMF